MTALATPGANAFLNGTALPATLHVQWHIGNPGAAGTANVAAQTTRQPFTRTAASGGAASNDVAADVASPVAAETWTHATLWSASSAGTCWLISALTNPITVAIGVPVAVGIGVLDLVASVWS